MTLAEPRDPEIVARGFVDWLSATRGAAYEHRRCNRPSDGLSSETVLCDVAPVQGDGSLESYALRLPPSGEGAFPVYDLAVQTAAQRAAAAGGVPAPVPVALVTDERWLGTAFMVMPAVAGRVPGPMPLYDRWITDASSAMQQHVYEGFVDQLGAVHRVDDRDLLVDVPARDVAEELAHWKEYLAWYADGACVVPALDAALRWCEDNQPSDPGPPCLLWGDVRLGNMIYDDDRDPVAVLDWEMATVGAAEHDVAWWRTLEAVQDEMFGRRVEGFPSLDVALERYQSVTGRELHHLEWFEVFAMVRSIAVMTRLAILDERAGRAQLFSLVDNPLLPILERRIEAAA